MKFQIKKMDKTEATTLCKFIREKHNQNVINLNELVDISLTGHELLKLIRDFNEYAKNEEDFK
jgi:uncharacterized protein (UPF0303 family)